MFTLTIFWTVGPRTYRDLTQAQVNKMISDLSEMNQNAETSVRISLTVSQED